LKLVAQVERDSSKENQGLEPLPDIDFNIRAGNTLVGYATYKEVEQMLDAKMDVFNSKDAIKARATATSGAYQAFREHQTRYDVEPAAIVGEKAALREHLAELNAELNRYLAQEYGVRVEKSSEFTRWKNNHKPFHWFVEFYDIIEDHGGFDVIIGNPPWREYAAARKEYTVQAYQTLNSGNLYALCIERSIILCRKQGFISFIVQLPLVSSSRMDSTRKLLMSNSGILFTSTFDDRPGKLFDGLQHCRSTIFIAKISGKSNNSLFVSAYHRWQTSIRQQLFDNIEYIRVNEILINKNVFPKYDKDLQGILFNKISTMNTILISKHKTDNFIFYQEATQYWIKAVEGLPYYSKNGIVDSPAHGRYIYLSSKDEAYVLSSILNSSIFYMYFISYGDCFHLSNNLVEGFPIPQGILEDLRVIDLGKKLMVNLEENSIKKTIRTSDGHSIEYDEFYAAKSKPIIDEIDRVLAQHYGFTDEELDFIINYDIKYRMGKDSEEDI
jgi:hypothetical protein